MSVAINNTILRKASQARGLAASWCRRILKGEKPGLDDALELISLRGTDRIDLFAAANRVREHFFGNRVSLCAIVNARSGRCPQDCAFCGQSAHHETGAPEYPLMNSTEIIEAAHAAADAGARSIGIVTSGTSLGGEDFETVLDAVRAISAEGRIEPDASIGLITSKRAFRLMEAGCRRYHHNLEAARGFYGSICTTRTWEDNASSIRAARDAGLEVCSGGIFGMGETPRQRIELLLELRDLGVASIAINFLNPISGTRLAGMEKLAPLDALQVIAVARMLMGGRHIRVCGGREAVLGGLQGMMFFAGASGAMIGDYLTTRGRDAADDLELLRKTELEW